MIKDDRQKSKFPGSPAEDGLGDVFIFLLAAKIISLME